MNRLDVALVILAVGGAVAGWRLGLARRIFGWAGLWIGVLIAAQVLPRVMPAASRATPGPFLVGATVMVVLGLTGHLIGSMIGARVWGSLQSPAARRVDSGLGSVAGVAGLVFMAWIVLPSMANIAGWPAELAHNSTLARAIDRSFGRPPSVLDGISRSLGPNPFPRVFSALGEDRSTIEAPPRSPVSQAVVSAAAESVVKLSGTVCDRTQSGSGFAVSSDLVVTNAHVVAGLSRIDVVTHGHGVGRGEVVAFDPDRDLAVVRTSMRLPTLPLGDASTGDVGVVLGYPGGGSLTVAPFRVGQRVDAQGRDIYDRDSVVRRILVMASSIAPGDSGGPLLDAQGAVTGVAFAIAPDRPNIAYAIRTEEVRKVLATVARASVSTGACLA